MSTRCRNDVELNLSAPGSYGYYGIDNIITACPETGGFVINFGNGSPGSCAGTPVVTTGGWYRFVFMFSNVGGNAYLTESVRSEPTGALVATSGPQPVGGSPRPSPTGAGRATSGCRPSRSAACRWPTSRCSSVSTPVATSPDPAG
ncbi:MAG: hypothetical protein ACM32E_15570 [Gemmatimonadota bacterium]